MTEYLVEAKDRINAILKDTDKKFQFEHQEVGDIEQFRTEGISENSFAGINLQSNNGAASVVRKYSEIIEKAAIEFGLNPDFLKAVIYTENARGWYDTINIFGSPTVLPGNVSEMWQKLIPGSDVNIAGDNIRISAKLLSEIAERLDKPYPEDVYSLYNSMAHDRTYVNKKTKDTPYFMKEALEGKAWEKRNWKLPSETRLRNPEGGPRGVYPLTDSPQLLDPLSQPQNYEPDGTTSPPVQGLNPPPGSDQPLPNPSVPDDALPRPPLPKPPVPDYALPRPPLPKPPVPDYALPRPPLPKPPVPDYALQPDFRGPPLPDSGPPLPDSGPSNRFLNNFDSGFLDLRIDNTLISTGRPPVAGNEVGLGVSLGGASVFIDEPTLNGGPRLGGSSFGAMEQANIIVGGIQPGAGTRTQASVTDSVRTLNDLFKPGISIRGPDYTRALGAGTSVVNQLNRARPIDPLVVDLDRDGVELLPRAPGGPAFDVDGDGALEVTGWVGADDGLVVIDRNGNGRIDDIREVVSDAMVPGSRDSREALASFDRNGDGRISAAEATSAGLLIWRDANSNGRTDSGELLSLSAAGITGFDLTARPAPVARIAGNAVRGDLAVETADGVGTVAAIVDFAADSDGTTATTKGDLVVATSQSGVVSVAALDGGAGRDTVQIVGARGVTLSLSDKRLEGAVGGDGADIIDAGDVIAGQAVENFVISGGGGDDVILGGGADDVLTGDDGADYVHGAGGDDYIRGGRGNDVLVGGIGNDWLRGGRGNDRLWGGAGDDQLQGEQGNDVLDGGAGFDVVQLTGNRDDYRFEQKASG